MQVSVCHRYGARFGSTSADVAGKRYLGLVCVQRLLRHKEGTNKQGPIQ